MEYEYGIAYRDDLSDPHRAGMTEDEARTWVADFAELGGMPGMFTVIRRPLGEWEIDDSEIS